jgi:hypothetical protein
LSFGFDRSTRTFARDNMGRTFWWLATEVMMKILRATLIQGDADSRRRCANIEGWIWESRHLKVTVRNGQWRTFRKMQSETKVRKYMGRMLWWLAMEVMVKILGDANSRRQCTRDRFEKIESNDWRGKIARGFRRIQSNYGQTEYGKNALATEVMVKILRRQRFQATMCEGRSRGFRNNWRGTMAV